MHERTLERWADATFNDKVTNGAKLKENQVNLDEYVNDLYKREEAVIENENKLQRIMIWMKK